ncbi:MAG: cytochrome c [Chloroflexi bacterium]|nr:cytochrome c [Chloroflexota bacterium]
MKQRKQRRMMKKRKQTLGLLAVGFGALLVVALLAYFAMSDDGSEGVTVEVIMPAELSAEAEKGGAIFKANCQACHGPSASGTKLGPPLIHDIYNPGHHSDEAFYVAAAIGVRQHHWPYGDMPAQSQVSREDVTLIIRYIRELQEANGIVYKPHRM